ncbi:MAG: amidohydrolase family protein [Lachnospiraceae bacterium]|nr:amidohydrolase family protein [Lachnospiraceae bacterium]
MKKKVTLPEHACNSHLHIIDPAFPNDGKAAEQRGTVEEYRALADRLCLSRAVFVQAKPFGTDNTCLLDAIQRYGREDSRGIAVVSGKISDPELRRLHEGGVRGLRFSVWNPANAVVSFDQCAPLAKRTKEMGWNMQLHMSSEQLLEHANEIAGLPGRIVIDHMGRLKPELGLTDPAYPFLCRLIDKGNTWVKLSGPYLNSKKGAPWDDAAKVACALAAYAPERMLWGNDFPHVTEKAKPDEWELLDTIDRWFAGERARRLALADNPAEVYGF